MAIDNVATIQLAVDISKALSSFSELQKKLNSLSIKNLKIDTVVNNETKSITTEVKKATREANELTKAVSKARTELANYTKNNPSVSLLGNSDAELNRLKDNLDKAIKQQVIFDNFVNSSRKKYKDQLKEKVQEKTKAERSITNTTMEQVEQRLTYAEQARKKEHEIAVKYANNGYKTDSEFFRDLGDYAFLGSANDAYKRRILGAETFTLKQAIANQIKAMDSKLYAKGDTYKNSADYTKDLEVLRKLQLAYQSLTQDIKNLTQAKKEEVVNNALPTYEKEIRDLRSAIQSNVRNNPNYMGSEAYQKDIAYIQQLEAEWNKIRNTIKGTNKEVSNQKPKVKEVKDEFKNYQSELAKIERSAAKIFHELNTGNLSIDRKQTLQNELIKLTKQYKDLNKESVQFRKTVGISSSRGFYDLNSTYDYFLAKFRSKVTAGIASQVEQFAMNAIPNFVNMMSTYEQNRVNLGQVLPNTLADNQKFMNDTMRDFISIASDYGTSVQDVVEAGRLWGRQYKEVAIIQELVRNSTKLSITDNMNLVEVNKGLEATMQQYNIHLKNANEAQEVSGKIVDTWAKLADNAVVTASDLAKANEQSASAAYQAGVGFDFLNAMIATMSGATGKAGAEIGRSIRSMLVSMNTAKAEKELAKLGIATKEIGTDGVMRIRSFENVITDLMVKLKTYPNDVSKVILAMSGGKYQYNNVMALLKNYEQLMKNLETVRTSKGWADEQVSQQYATVSRQIKALNADLQQLVVTLNESGASNGISNVVQAFRNLVQIISKLDPELIKLIGRLLYYSVVFKTTSGLFVVGANKIKNFSDSVSSLGSVLQAVRDKTLSGGSALKYFGATCLSNIGLVLGFASAIISLYSAWDSYYKIRNKSEIENQEYQNTTSQIEAYKEYIDIVTKANSTEGKSKVSKEDLVTASEKLRKAIGDEAYARITNSKDIKKAIETEMQALIERQKVQRQARVNSIKWSIQETEAEAKQVRERIALMETELTAVREQYKTKLMVYNEFLKSMNIESPFAKKVFSNLFGVKDGMEEIESIEYSIKNATDRLSKLNTKLTDNRLELNNIVKDIDSTIKGSGGGTVPEDDNDKGKTGTNYAQQAERNKYETERNRLWYEGSIQAKAYSNTLKEINDLEKSYGSTITSISAKSDLYNKRSKDLDNYRKKLEDFKNTLIKELDYKMANNSELASQVQYRVDGTEAEKLKNIEINKELYQQLKTYNSLTNMISAVNQKLEETKTQQIDIADKQRNISEEFRKQRISDAEKENAIKLARLNRPTNINYDRQKTIVDIENEMVILDECVKKITSLKLEISNMENSNDEQAKIKLAGLRENLNTEVQLYEETKARIAELEYQKNANIREGLANVANEFLIQGNTLRDIWSNLWKDLAREAIQRLFQVKAQASLLGSLFGIFGGTASPAQSMAAQGFDPSFGIKPLASHTGSSVGAYPKMHTGGMVEKGRLGVVPKLKDDEVVRTLQVGEEVNSVSDRRSNEILATVAMKAIDARNQQPNNINIMAIDARSFAEYLNDNADVLVAVLNKQGALGRR